ncbi:MAG: peptide ABC transporter substrate-binding protein [Rubellimicrobium sp.]|nr:peptide ABC transporter substrate-binding protein [Rubellimicrobium sp.]
MGTSNLILNRRRTLGLMGATGIAAALPGFGPLGQAAAAGTPAGQVIVGFSQEPTVFNPNLPHIEVDEGIYYAIFDTLIDVNPDGSFFPLLAAEVPTQANGGISEDGKTWTVKLREGVTWHDGTPFTAHDVKFTLELLVNPDFRSWRRNGHELISAIEVVSDTEIRWTMERAFAPYASILATTWIVPRHAFEGVDPNDAPFNNSPIGTGAFKWANRVAGDHIELVANTDYFGDGPHLERLVVKYIPDMTVLYTQFRSGDIDCVGVQWISPDHYEEARGLPERVVTVDGVGFFESMALNQLKPLFQEKAVREALYAAIDKEAIIDALYYGVPTPTETFMPREFPYYNENLPAHEFSIARANEILDGAGWTRGADGIREKDGTRLAFTNSTTAGNHLREQVQQFLQQTFLEIGAEMTISNLPPAVMWGDYWMLSQFDTVIVGLNVFAGPDPDCADFFMSTSIPAKGGNGQNTFAYESAEVDRLLAEGAGLMSFEERLPIYRRLQEVIREDLPFLPIYQYAVVRGKKEGLEGYTANINNRIDTWNVRDWSWT